MVLKHLYFTLSLFCRSLYNLKRHFLFFILFAHICSKIIHDIDRNSKIVDHTFLEFQTSALEKLQNDIATLFDQGQRCRAL